jgi:hypothetical protein
VSLIHGLLYFRIKEAGIARRLGLDKVPCGGNSRFRYSRKILDKVIIIIKNISSISTAYKRVLQYNNGEQDITYMDDF